MAAGPAVHSIWSLCISPVFPLLYPFPIKALLLSVIKVDNDDALSSWLGVGGGGGGGVTSHLVQGESAHAESGQFDGVQQGHLGHAICFGATAGPVLVTLDLEVKERVGQRSSGVTVSLSLWFVSSGCRSIETRSRTWLQLSSRSSIVSVNPRGNKENITL